MGTEINYTGQKQLYYTPSEVVIHNQPNDCWVSFLHKVWNITPLIKEHTGEQCIKPLLAFAGKDISEWFDDRTDDIRYHIHPVSGCRLPYIPHGRIPDVEVQVPATRWMPLDHIPWWKDEKYKVGILTRRSRPIRIINHIFGFETYLNVCSEDTILRIKERYSMFNSECDTYIWRYSDKILHDDKTLEENGVLDERERFANCGLPPNFYIPGILISYCDELNWVSDSSESE